MYNRCGWIEDYANKKPMWFSLPSPMWSPVFASYIIAPQFALSWQTHFSLAMGQWAKYFLATANFPRDEILRRKQENPVELWLVPIDQVKKHGAKPGKIMPESFFEKSHCITDTRCVRNREYFTAMVMEEFEQQPFSIFLPKEEKIPQENKILDPSLQFTIVDAETRAMIFSCDFFSNFEGKDLIHSLPYYIDPRPNPPEIEKGLQVLSCLESKVKYEVDFSLRGVLIDNPNGRLLKFYVLLNFFFFLLIKLPYYYNFKY